MTLAILHRLTKADIIFYLLPLIMINLAAGTLAQRSLGLYAAQKMFFSTFVTWIGPAPFSVPLPGGYALTGFLAACLLLKFLLDSPWRLSRAGINLAHLGALVLLFGGLLTSLGAREGYMLLAEGDASPYVYNYRQRQLYIFENDALLRAVNFEAAAPGRTQGGLPFTLTFDDRCENCSIAERAKTPGGKPHRGMAQFMALGKKPSEKDPEENLGGVTFEIAGLGKKQDGVYIAIEGMPRPIEFSKNGKNYKIIFGKEQRRLPFSIGLKDFQKDTHPGTAMASGYSSSVVIADGGIEWPAHIEMNRPLRYKGYTFYQSSFGEGPDKDISVLSVVENKGRIFPYIGTGLLALGLLLHLVLRARERTVS